MGLNTARLDFLVESETKLEGEMVGTSDLGCWLPCSLPLSDHVSTKDGWYLKSQGDVQMPFRLFLANSFLPLPIPPHHHYFLSPPSSLFFSWPSVSLATLSWYFYLSIPLSSLVSCSYLSISSLPSCIILLHSTPHRDLPILSLSLPNFPMPCSFLSTQHTHSLDSSILNLRLSIMSQLIDPLTAVSQCLVHTSTIFSSRSLFALDVIPTFLPLLSASFCQCLLFSEFTVQYIYICSSY